jgi:3',5'-cyclic AMP phosphodiesterase CpdA
VLLAQLTDTHVLDPDGETDNHLLDNNRRLALAVERLNRESVQPRAIVATGDMIDHGTEVEMGLLMDLLAPLDAPVLAVPGNHDDRGLFREAFDLPWASADNLSWSVDVDDVRIIGLDTIIPGSHGGLLDAARLAWLGDALDESADRRTLIAMHHPPFLCGIGWMDTMALKGWQAFTEVVAGRPNIERILCGHLHRPMVTTTAGVTTTVGPSTAQHIELDLAEGAPVGVITDPGGYHLHQYRDGHWVSHIRYVDTGAEPVRPSWA